MLRIVDGGCVLTATGQALQADLNDTWSGGHCFGFAALAGFFATDQLDKAEHLATGPNVYDEPASDQLDGLISRYASTQISPPTSAANSPSSVADTLEQTRGSLGSG